MKLNIGSGNKKLEGYVNIDNQPKTNPDYCFNIGAEVWPFEDDSVEAIRASHILEHLTTDEFMHVMKEMYRVAKPGAPIAVVVPHPRHDVFVNDPTHKTPITLTTLAQFSLTFHRDTGWVHTPYCRYHEVDFTIVDCNGVIDERMKDKTPEEVFEAERTQNNVIIEWHILMAAEKPYVD